jgi:hypothetical protein
VAFLPLCCNRWYFCVRLHPVDFHVKYADWWPFYHMRCYPRYTYNI